MWGTRPRGNEATLPMVAIREVHCERYRELDRFEGVFLRTILQVLAEFSREVELIAPICENGSEIITRGRKGGLGDYLGRQRTSDSRNKPSPEVSCGEHLQSSRHSSRNLYAAHGHSPQTCMTPHLESCHEDRRPGRSYSSPDK